MLINDGAGTARAAAPDRERIHVEISTNGTSVATSVVGSAAEALRSSTLTKQERVAVRNVLAGIDRLRDDAATGSPIADALDGIDRIVLRVDRAPAAGEGHVLVPPDNPMRLAPGAKTSDVLMPMDVVLHELIHNVQEQVSGVRIGSRGGREERGLGGVQNLDAMSVAEGLADAGAAIELETWRSGDAYFAKGSKLQTVRDYDRPDGGPGVLSTLRTNYNSLRRRDADPHVEGGLAGELFQDIATDTSYAQAGVVLRGVLEDEAFRASNQGWFELRDALQVQASLAHARRDDALAEAIGAALDEAGFPR